MPPYILKNKERKKSKKPAVPPYFSNGPTACSSQDVPACSSQETPACSSQEAERPSQPPVPSPSACPTHGPRSSAPAKATPIATPHKLQQVAKPLIPIVEQLALVHEAVASALARFPEAVAPAPVPEAVAPISAWRYWSEWTCGTYTDCPGCNSGQHRKTSRYGRTIGWPTGSVIYRLHFSSAVLGALGRCHWGGGTVTSPVSDR